MTNKGMGKGRVAGYPTAGQANPNELSAEDLPNEMKGKNRLQGDDQEHVRNQRSAAPDLPSPRPKRGSV